MTHVYHNIVKVHFIARNTKVQITADEPNDTFN